MRMLQSGEGFGLELETLFSAIGDIEVRGEDLQGDDASEGGLLGLVDQAHAAARDQRNQ